MTDEGAILRLKPLILKAERQRKPLVDWAFLRGAAYAMSISTIMWTAVILAILKFGHGLTLQDLRVGAGIVCGSLALICFLAARDIMRRRA